MTYPDKCGGCNQPLYGPVKYCPFCGADFLSADIISEKQNLNDLRFAIVSSLPQREYTPDFRQFINKKGKDVGISEESSDILLFEVLKERGFTPEREESNNPLSVCWYTAEARKLEDTTPQQPKSTVTPEDALHEQHEAKEVEELVEDLKHSQKATEEPLPRQEESKEELKKPEVKGPGKNRLSGVVAAIIILAVGYFAYTNFIATSPFLAKIDRAIVEKRYISPPGNNVADFYKAKKAESPNSAELKDAISRIRQNLEPLGDAAFQRLYSDSIDYDWDNTVNIYKLLNEIMPDDRDIAAKAEFCRAHQIIKSKGGKNYEDALARYQKALDLKPNWVFAINGIAKVYIRKDSPYYNKEEALNWYSKVSEADPNFPWAYTNIAAIYMEDKQWDMAEQALLNALRIKNNSSSIFTELGKVCEKQQKTQDAKNYFQEAMKFEKDSQNIAWLQKKIGAIQ